MIGYAAAVLIGMLLGIVGGGGSILTLPVLVYAFELPPFTAATYSLFIVGVTSAAGAARFAKLRLIDYGAAARFALPAFVAIYVVRGWVLPALQPRDEVLMLLLAAAMIASAYGMLRKTVPRSVKRSAVASTARGFGVGIFTGLVGAGGGFLLVPALTLVEGLPVRAAVATSLFVIALNGLFGFASDMISASSVDWTLLGRFTALTSLGLAGGMRISRQLTEGQLRVWFAWLVIVMAVAIVIKEVVL